MGAVDRPAPAFPAPDGFRHVVAEVDTFGEWRVLEPGVAKRCRWGSRRYGTGCDAAAVAEVDRNRGRGSPRWWAYCGEHLYGRWIEAGRVVGWKLERL